MGSLKWDPQNRDPQMETPKNGNPKRETSNGDPKRETSNGNAKRGPQIELRLSGTPNGTPKGETLKWAPPNGPPQNGDPPKAGPQMGIPTWEPQMGTRLLSGLLRPYAVIYGVGGTPGQPHRGGGKGKGWEVGTKTQQRPQREKRIPYITYGNAT